MIKYEDLRDRQNEILDFIKKYIAKKKYSPSIREIAKAVNLSSPATVYVHLENLIKKGYIKKVNNNKNIELLIPNEYDPDNNIVYIPLLDKNSERKNFENLKTNKNFIPFPSLLIPKDTNVFAFLINDKKLINKGINKGDIVIIKKNNTYKDDDIVIVLNDNKVFLTIFHNDFPPTNDTIILGKVISLYRKF